VHVCISSCSRVAFAYAITIARGCDKPEILPAPEAHAIVDADIMDAGWLIHKADAAVSVQHRKEPWDSDVAGSEVAE